MFVGHYAVAFAAKRFAPRTSLGVFFIGVQLLDLLWAPAVLLGLEHVRIVPGLLPASSFDFYDFPWTHGLVAALAWSWFAFRFTKNAVLGACIFSHWVLDFVVHWKDLPLFRGGTKVGLGLWRSREATLGVEAILLIGGLLVYLAVTQPKTKLGRSAAIWYVGFLIALQAFNLYGPPPSDVRQLALTGEIAYLAFAAIAWRIDRLREPVVHVEPPISILES